MKQTPTQPLKNHAPKKIKARIHSVEKKHGIDLLSLFSRDKNECNQCHSNCNDCGWDR